MNKKATAFHVFTMVAFGKQDYISVLQFFHENPPWEWMQFAMIFSTSTPPGLNFALAVSSWERQNKALSVDNIFFPNSDTRQSETIGCDLARDFYTSTVFISLKALPMVALYYVNENDPLIVTDTS